MKRPAPGRDDFTASVKEKLAKRVNYHCSRPGCGAPALGPTEGDSHGVSNVGKAAHITAAARGGPRYDPSLTREQRQSIDNGIWLCSICADLIDRDTRRFPDKLLRSWKARAECEAKEAQGKPTPSAADLAVYQTHALGQKVGGRSITSFIERTFDIAQREIEKFDDRLTVEILRQRGETRFTIHPREEVPFQIRVQPAAIEEFTDKFGALLDHGHRLEMDSSVLTFTGSKIFELMEAPGTIVIETNAKRQAVLRLTFTAPQTEHPDVVEVAGELVGGRRSLTFTGVAFGGLYQMTFVFPTTAANRVDLEVKNVFDLGSWNGHSISRLPYFDRFGRFIRAVRTSVSLKLSLEVDGNPFIAGQSSALVKGPQSEAIEQMLEYLKQARSVAERYPVDVTFQLDRFDVDDVERLHKMWFLLFGMSTLGGSAPPVSVDLLPTDEAAADRVRNSIQDGEPRLVRVEQELPEPVLIFGTPIVIGVVLIDWSKATFQSDSPLEGIRPGSSYTVRIVAAPDCRITVRAGSMFEGPRD